MANGTDVEDFVVLSRVRTGLKREFEFALKVQAEICGSLGRTRSGKAQNAPAWSPGKRSNKKLKEEAKFEKDKSDLEKSMRIAEESVDLMSEEEAKSDVVDVEEPKRDVVGCEEEESKRVELEKEEETKLGIIEPMCEDEVDKDGNEKHEPEEGVVGLREEKQEEEKESKMDVDIAEKESELGDAVKNVQEEKANEDLVIEKEPCIGEEEKELKVDVDIGEKETELQNADKNVEEEKGKEDLVIESEPCKGDSSMQVLVSCKDDSKIEEVVKEEKPLRRFTRSLLKPKMETVKETAVRDAVVVDVSDEKDGGNDNRVGAGSSPLKPETNVSTKFLRNFPTKLKDLLDSGMLEGLNVRYARSLKV